METRGSATVPKLSLLLVDDAAPTRKLLSAVLETVPRLKIVGEATTGAQAVQMAGDLQPDVILLDLSLPDTDGSVLLPTLLDASPDSKIVILSNSARAEGPRLLAAGASGYIEKGLGPTQLVQRLARAIGTPLAERGMLSNTVSRHFVK
jgi:DNA-binding NarL/FixJ family response regulator